MPAMMVVAGTTLLKKVKNAYEMGYTDAVIGIWEDAPLEDAMGAQWGYAEYHRHATGYITVYLREDDVNRPTRERSINVSDWTWYEDWRSTATTDYAVNKAGDTMTGNLKIRRGTPSLLLGDTGTGREGRVYYGADVLYLMNDADTSHYATLMLGKETTSMGNLLRVQMRTDDGTNTYSILHTGNKPSGSYTGNGDATERVIDVGGIGNVIVIYSTNGIAIATPEGCFAYSFLTGATGVATVFRNGQIITYSDNATINANGITYYYYVP